MKHSTYRYPKKGSKLGHLKTYWLKCKNNNNNVHTISKSFSNEKKEKNEKKKKRKKITSNKCV